MKFIPIVLLTLFFAKTNYAQDYIVPLGSNVVLEKAAKRLGKAEIHAPSFAARSTDCQDLDQMTYTAAENIYCESGIEREFCISTISFPEIDFLLCENCNELESGTVSIDNSTFCIKYTPESGITLDFSDTLNIRVCDIDTTCQSLDFPMIIRRANNTINIASETIGTESTIDLCISDLALPGTTIQYNFLDCQESYIGGVSSADSCFTYQSTRFAGTDMICLQVCDEFCICDEYSFEVTVTGDTLNLPFFDDFSYAGPYPDDTLWLDDQAFVNNTLAYQPPSIGFATFDGLNERGAPYASGFSKSDFLTSNYLDLSNFSASDDVFLSFYAAPKGLGFTPAPQDTFILEFKNENEEWETVWQANIPIAYPSPEKVPFDTIVTIPITQSAYFFKGFQFRFINYSEEKALTHLWHLDYVRLESNQEPTGTFADIAFTQGPSNILRNYAEMPWKQFKGFQNNELADVYAVSLRNFFSFPFTVENSSLEIKELNNNVDLSTGNTLVNALNVPNNSQVDINENYPGYNLENAFSADEQELRVEINYEIQVGPENPGSFPAVGRNNRVSRIVNFGNMLAYDDGTAEVGVKLGSNGQRVAMEFDMNVTDSLQGFAVMFPRFNQSAGVDFRVLIYNNDLDGDPIYTSPNYETFFADDFGTIVNGFITYKLRDENFFPMALTLSAGKYFLVLEKTQSSNSIHIGVDQNNEQFSDKQQINLSNSWASLVFDGSLLLRPILGSEKPIPTEISEQSAELQFEIFPNPATDIIYWNNTDEQLEFSIFDLYGREILHQQNKGRVDISQLSSGSYYLQLMDQENGFSGVRIFQILH